MAQGHIMRFTKTVATHVRYWDPQPAFEEAGLTGPLFHYCHADGTPLEGPDGKLQSIRNLLESDWRPRHGAIRTDLRAFLSRNGIPLPPWLAQGARDGIDPQE